MVKYWHFCLLSATSCLLLSTDNIDARVLSSIPSESSHHHSHIHTLSHLDLSHFSPNLFLKQSDKQSYLTASVCFITDAGNCSGQEFGNLETPDGTNRPDYDTIPEQCRDAGYTKTSCPAGQHLVNPCPSDNRYYERCECNENLTEICNIPYYGVGPSCDGKYEKCERDDDRACKEEGYPLTGSCPTLQVPNRRCPYDSNYYDKCVCQSGLISCPSPKIGVGPSCGGKYQSCQCPSSYKSCDCGPAVGASSCTINGRTTYSSCKACCDDTCPSGYSKSYPGGCYDTSRTGCGTTCYKSKECCDDTCASGYSKTKPSGCYDTKTTGCGNTCYKAKECEPQCDSSYKYTCTGKGESSLGDSCGGKYKECDCAYPYVWLHWEGKCGCPSNYIYDCTGPNEFALVGGCDGKYPSCACYGNQSWTDDGCVASGTIEVYVTSTGNIKCEQTSAGYTAFHYDGRQARCSICSSTSYRSWATLNLGTYKTREACQSYISSMSSGWRSVGVCSSRTCEYPSGTNIY